MNRSHAFSQVATAPGRAALLIAQMPAQLGLQAPLEHRFDHLGEEPANAGQRQPARVDRSITSSSSPASSISLITSRAEARRLGRVRRNAQRVLPLLVVIGHGHQVYSFNSA